MKRSMISAAILGALGLSSTFSALAVNHSVDICAGPFEKTLAATPTTPIPMWGYALGGMTAGVCDNPPTAPGPRITIPDGAISGNDSLDIVLHNSLPVPTSIVIPGTVKRMAPVFFTAPDGTQRMRSFDVETPAGSSSTVPYSWSNLAPGSYMYHSGSHAQIQVQMGLYGAVTNDFATGVAYPDRPYDEDVILFYSEIDRVIHESVAAGNHNVFKTTVSEADMKSTIDYDPKYFLIDVDVDDGFGSITYEFNDLPILKLPSSFNPLVRFFNAGLETHVPTVFEASFDVIAEDGKKYPNVRKQYSVALPPLKTKDARLNITGLDINSNGSATGKRTFRLTDSAMAVSNPDSVVTGPVITLSNEEIANGTDNGMVLQIEVAASDDYVASVFSGDEPKAIRDNLSVPEGGTISDIMALATSNDINAAGATIDILGYPKYGQLTDHGAGDFSYQHEGGERKSDSFVYLLTNAAGEYSSAGVKISVNPLNDSPVANDDIVNAKVGQMIEIRPLDNDTDSDSPLLSIDSVEVSSLGSLEIAGQVIVFTATSEGTEVVDYTISDAPGATSTASISLTVAGASTDGTYTPPTDGGSGDSDSGGTTGVVPKAEDDKYNVVEGAVLNIAGNTILGLMANDSPGAKVNTGLLEYPEHGAIEIFEDGTFIYTHDGFSEEDDHFKYEIYNDAGAAKADVEIKISPKLSAPNVKNDRAKTKMDEAVLIDLLRNDKDQDSALDPNGIVITKIPAHGVVEIVTQGHVRYTPNSGYTGEDHFRYQLKDAITGELSKRSANVKVEIR